MLTIIAALAEAAEQAKDYDAELGAIAWSLVGAAILYAIIATWIATPRGDRHH
jgi:hypothetical protein